MTPAGSSAAAGSLADRRAFRAVGVARNVDPRALATWLLVGTVVLYWRLTVAAMTSSSAIRSGSSSGG